MASYWSGYKGTGMVLTQPEFDKMLEVYMEKNPEQSDITKTIDNYGCDITKFTMSKYAGESMPKLQDDNKYDNKITYIEQILKDKPDRFIFKPFYKSDDTINMNHETSNGCWIIAEYHHTISDSGADCCYVLSSNKDMLSPKIFEEKPYESYQDFIQEFKDKLESYLPSDFDWNAHLGIFSY